MIPSSKFSVRVVRYSSFSQLMMEKSLSTRVVPWQMDASPPKKSHRLGNCGCTVTNASWKPMQLAFHLFSWTSDLEYKDCPESTALLPSQRCNPDQSNSRDDIANVWNSEAGWHHVSELLRKHWRKRLICSDVFIIAFWGNKRDAFCYSNHEESKCRTNLFAFALFQAVKQCTIGVAKASHEDRGIGWPYHEQSTASTGLIIPDCQLQRRTWIMDTKILTKSVMNLLNASTGWVTRETKQQRLEQNVDLISDTANTEKRNSPGNGWLASKNLLFSIMEYLDTTTCKPRKNMA